MQQVHKIQIKKDWKLGQTTKITEVILITSNNEQIRWCEILIH